MSQPRSRKPASLAFLVLAVALLVGLAGYVRWTGHGGDDSAGASPTRSTVESIQNLRRGPHMVIRHTRLGEAYGRTVLAALDSPNTSRAATPLACDRVHYAAGRGVCLAADRGVVTTYRAITFDETFAVRSEIPLPGVPSRVRVAPDGTRAGLTVFVSGDSYTSGTFSTRTLIIDTGTGRVLGDLEEYAVTRDGQPFKAVDFNFWGVTFADANRFYATLASGGRMYLVEGDVDSRRARTLREGIECPSLSPDRTRVVFKKRVTSSMRLVWRVAVLDLQTLQETLVAETRSVDDQSEWLDNDHVVYALPSDARAGSTDLWVVGADGTGSPRILAEDAWSPAFVR
jgi:hypothetical protein